METDGFRILSLLDLILEVYKFIENKNTFEENEWQELYKLSEGTFVEETDQLKNSAAGAGLTDND